MSQTEKARRFSELHVPGAPLVLCNAWDAGSVKSIADAGAKAIATSSWSVAAAQGYSDGEAIPIESVEQVVARIAATVDVPITVDFEAGYSEDEADLAANVSRLLDLGVVGINFEDRIVKSSGLYSVDRQARRIAAIRQAGSKRASTSSSMPARTCFSRAKMQCWLSMKPSSEPKPMRLGCLGVLRSRPGQRCIDRADCQNGDITRERHGHGRSVTER